MRAGDGKVEDAYGNLSFGKREYAYSRITRVLCQGVREKVFEVIKSLAEKILTDREGLKSIITKYHKYVPKG